MKKKIKCALFLLSISCGKKEEINDTKNENNIQKESYVLNYVEKKKEIENRENVGIILEDNYYDKLLINYMQTQNKKLSYSEAKVILQLVKKISSEERMNPIFALAIMNVESHFNHSTKSSAGAVGIMQLMPINGKRFNVNVYSLEGNIRGGIKHFKNDLKNNRNNITLALAAYNAGQGRVNNNTWQNIKETKEYVVKVRDKIYFFDNFFSQVQVSSNKVQVSSSYLKD